MSDTRAGNDDGDDLRRFLAGERERFTALVERH